MTDPKRLVSEGYDKVADAYLQQLGFSKAKDAWTSELAIRTRPQGRILDLGCGAGIPVARGLLKAGFEVVGVDGSTRQVELARQNAPSGEFMVGDMTTVEFAEAHFDGVAAFFSILHVPRAEQSALLQRIGHWLRPGGAFVANFGVSDNPGWSGEWLGAPTFFSGFDALTNEQMVRDAGFVIERTEVLQADDEDAQFLWIVATKPDSE